MVYLHINESYESHNTIGNVFDHLTDLTDYKFDL